jgi:L-alanine-DL-glutamate epimerase-like enolase superfamily enzyme
MKIEHVEAITYRIPPSVPWEDATHVVKGLEFVVTTVKTDNGFTGVGFSYTTGVGGTSIETLVNDYLANMLVGKDPRNIEAIWTFLYNQVHRCGTGGINTFAIASIDIALWDILGKFYNQPLYRLLGGAREEIVAYGSGIDYSYSYEQLFEMIDEYIEKGYQTIKIKVGYDRIEDDIERIRRVKERIGTRRLLVDINQKWNAHHAVQACAQYDPFLLGWIEEPLSADDIEGHARLKRSMKTPLAIGESLYTKYQFADYLKNDAVDIIQADVGRVGGITEWIKIAHLADSYFRPVAPHFLMELSVSLLCAVPNGMILENVKGGSLNEMGVLQHPIIVENGVAKPPQIPGHGVIFDDKKLSPYRVDRLALRQLDLRSSK